MIFGQSESFQSYEKEGKILQDIPRDFWQLLNWNMPMKRWLTYFHFIFMEFSPNPGFNLDDLNGSSRGLSEDGVRSRQKSGVQNLGMDISDN